ncbi:MAG: DUF4198 domain-containing protein [Sporocytophaga sp.]|nr:DUF4198 domain-containing protein [Sporocytophaga sp.]
MKITSLLTFLFSLFLLNIGNAHNIWIETNNTGKLGKEHSVKIYLGGYGENERDSVSKWFSNTRDVVISLTKPDGTKENLTTKAAGNYLEALFTPAKDGYYTISVSHEVADVYGSAKIQYYAASQVKVGASVEGINNVVTATDMPVQLITTNPVVKKGVSLKVMYKGKNLNKSSVSVASPSGWVKGFETNDGTFTFDAIWPGVYVIEAYHTDKTEGSLNGKEYKLIRNTSTYSITVGR